MYPVSEALLATIRASHRIDVAVEFDQQDEHWQPLRVVDGTAEADRGSKTRWSIEATVADDQNSRQVTPFGSRLRAFRGVVLGSGATEWIPLGVCRVESVSHTRGEATRKLSALSFEQAIDDAKFLVPRSLNGGSASYAIRALIHEVLPEAEVQVRVPDQIIGSLTEDEDRWGLIDGDSDDASVAKLLGAEVFCDNQGRFIVDTVPRVRKTPVWTVDTGVMVSHDGEYSRDEVYNVVVTKGEEDNATEEDEDDPAAQVVHPPPKDETIADPDESEIGDDEDTAADEAAEKEIPGPAYAWDNDPDSPTFAGHTLDDKPGPFGRVVEHYSSSALKDMGDCQRAAEAHLAQGLGLQHTVGLDAIVNPAVQPGDTIRIAPPNQPASNHVIDKISIPLEAKASMTLDTRADREVTVAAT